MSMIVKGAEKEGGIRANTISTDMILPSDGVF